MKRLETYFASRPLLGAIAGAIVLIVLGAAVLQVREPVAMQIMSRSAT